MKEEQALITLAHLAVTAQLEDFRNVAALVPAVDALLVLLAYTPLLTPSSELLFVQGLALSKSENGSGDLMDSLKPTPMLHLTIDVSPEVVEERCRALKNHLEKESETYLFDVETTDPVLEFIKANTRKKDSQLSLAYDDELFRLVDDQSEFQHWWNTVLVPYKYFNDKGGATSLIKFESYASSDSQKAVDIFALLTNRGVSTLDSPFVQFLKSTGKTTLLDFIQELSVVDDITSLTSLRLFNSIVTLLFPSSDLKDESLKLIIDIYESFPHPTAEALRSISQTLSVLSETIPSPEKQVKDLISATNAANAYPLEFSSLSELTALSKESQKQEAFFSKLIDSLTPQSAPLFLSQTSILKPALFPNVAEESARKIVMSRFLSLRLYSEIEFSPEDEDLVIEHFWTCFKTASNGSKERGELNAGHRVLESVKSPSVKIRSLVKFVDAVDELFQYSIFFKRDLSFRPVDLLTIDDFSTVAQILLERNESLYLSPEKLHTLLMRLSAVLSQSRFPSLADIECLCIGSSLTKDDFPFAYTRTISLFSKLDRSELESKWDSFFQVAKYVSPDWLDTEIPESVIRDQMILLSKVLAVAPIKHSHIIIEQWKLLDMELSLRNDNDRDEDQVLDSKPKSLDQRLARALSSTAGELMKDGYKGSQVSNLLANGLGWAMGGRQ